MTTINVSPDPVLLALRDSALLLAHQEAEAERERIATQKEEETNKRIADAQAEVALFPALAQYAPRYNSEGVWIELPDCVPIRVNIRKRADRTREVWYAVAPKLALIFDRDAQEFGQLHAAIEHAYQVRQDLPAYPVNYSANAARAAEKREREEALNARRDQLARFADEAVLAEVAVQLQRIADHFERSE